MEQAQTRDAVLKTPDNCGGCHEHEFHTYQDSFHGKATDLGFLTAATCSDCHSPHKQLSPDNPLSSVHADNLAETCGKCHPGASEGFLTFDPHLDPTDPHGFAPLYYIWLFMTALLVSVFSFFVVHALLWLQRSIVGYVRGEFDEIRHRSGPYVLRFKPVHMWVHLAIITSFLTLAATGLPLKFHSAEWAQTLSDYLPGLEAARLLHRVAAIITFGYGIFHLVYLLRRTLIQKDYSLLWGWRSLIPQPNDITDMFANIKYFLYLGPQPKMGRWTYWEKFDYFAVFWGVMIIGFSGLALWFPVLFTAFLPGWVLNAAYIIHSDEALLATGFIFVFHFFHTHLRPEVFPIDRVMFTGKMTLARFKEERPIEYQQLVDEGRLEDFITEDPKPHEVRRANIFGFIAVATGLSLVAGMLAAFLL